MLQVKSKLTSEGKKLVKVLESRYGMSRENAIQLLKDGGPLFAQLLKPLCK